MKALTIGILIALVLMLAGCYESQNPSHDRLLPVSARLRFLPGPSLCPRHSIWHLGPSSEHNTVHMIKKDWVESTVTWNNFVDPLSEDDFVDLPLAEFTRPLLQDMLELT